MRTTLSCLIAGLSQSCIGWPAVIDAQSTTYMYTTKCSSWSPVNELLNDFGSTVDVTTGSCIYGQAAAGYTAGMTTCAVTNLNPDGVTAYACQCITQADANGGDAAFAAMQRKATVKRRLRRAGFVFLGINVLLCLCLVGICGGEGSDEQDDVTIFRRLLQWATSEGFGCLLIIIFLACGYTNRDLFNPDLTPYFVGCGSQAESVGAYSIGSMRTALELDGSGIAIDGSGDSTLPATAPITEPDEVGVPGGTIAAIVVPIAIAIAGSILFVCSRRGAAQEEKGSQNRAAAEAQAEEDDSLDHPWNMGGGGSRVQRSSSLTSEV